MHQSSRSNASTRLVRALITTSSATAHCHTPLYDFTVPAPNILRSCSAEDRNCGTVRRRASQLSYGWQMLTSLSFHEQLDRLLPPEKIEYRLLSSANQTPTRLHNIISFGHRNGTNYTVVVVSSFVTTEVRRVSGRDAIRSVSRLKRLS